MEVAKLVLEYLKVVLSPQAVVGGIAVVFFLMFREDIKALMRRIAKIKFPGGGEVSTSQLERASEESPAGQTPPPAPPGGVPLPEGLSLTPEQVRAIREAFDAERARAVFGNIATLTISLYRRHRECWIGWLPSTYDQRCLYSITSGFL